MSGGFHGEEETAEFAKTAEKTWLSDLGAASVLRHRLDDLAHDRFEAGQRRGRFHVRLSFRVCLQRFEVGLAAPLRVIVR